MELRNKKVLVVGLGTTGVATALFLKEQGAKVTVSEKRDREEVLSSLQVLNLKEVDVETGGHRVKTFLNTDLIVVSPGVSPECAPLKMADEKGIEIISEIELAYRFIRSPIIAVTGTNGKTTTVKLITEIFRNSGLKVFLGGNVGNPLIEYVLNQHDEDYIIAEISSFQLEKITTFKPYIGVLLNLQQDHLDRYASYGDYIAAKAKLFTNQDSGDYAVLNADDHEIQKLSSLINAATLFFSCKRPVTRGIYCRGNQSYFTNGTGETCFSLERLHLQGNHNRQNIMAAIAAAKLCGCPPEAIQHTIEGFKGLPHRLEFVAEVGRIFFYNDSKATNVDSVVRALEALDPPLILIAGGKDKGGDYRPLIPAIKQKVKALILVGEAKEKMQNIFKSTTTTVMAETLEEAFNLSLKHAAAGDTVLLSPACSSFDMFSSYEERGNLFKALVTKLAGRNNKKNGNKQGI